MKQSILFISMFLFSLYSFAYNVTGTIKDKSGNALAFSSILIKGTAQGTTANSKGIYVLQLQPGEYVLQCQHVGYKTAERRIIVNGDLGHIDFILEEQQYDVSNIVVKSNREDPAYEIIRNAIMKRPTYLKEIKKFQCEVYLKGQLQLRNYPKKFFGEKVDFEDGDTSKRKMIFLSESVARYSVEEPNDAKVEVISTRVSGNAGGFGFSNPQIISFYSNNISIGQGLNPRGFVSPLSDNALNFYKYKYEGSFFENGKEIHRIKVIPKRKYEPLFSGYINILEGEWRIYSVQLTLLKEQQMQLLDTLTIEQIYVPLQDKWVIKQQVIYPAGKIFSFDFFGNFVQVYDKFDIQPAFKKKFFNNTIIKFLDSSNKKTLTYWDSIRPIPLLTEEAKDYKKKDSLEQVRKDPKYLDSLDRIHNKVTFSRLFLTGQTFNNEKKKESLSIKPLIGSLDSYNTVEGYVLNLSADYFKRYEGRRSLSITPEMRYGISNKLFNGSVAARYNYGKKYINSFRIAAGANVYQYNNANPISSFVNTLATLYWTRNYMKLYEASFASIGYSKGIGEGVTLYAKFDFQDRTSLENTSNYYWRKVEGREFTPNYPTDISATNMEHNKASIASVGITWRPGNKYIELPDRKFSIGSKYPTFDLSLTRGVNGLFGSDVDYTKWRFRITDDLNMKLGGLFKYRLTAGGFLNDKKVFLPDYQHFMGNRTAVATDYLNSFQLMPYYLYSNTSSFYATGFAEYHLNGLLTNKIPLLRKWNWFFVLGGSALYVNKDTHYYEAIFSIENIFKVLRVDFVEAYMPNNETTSGVRFSIPVLSGNRR